MITIGARGLTVSCNYASLKAARLLETRPTKGDRRQGPPQLSFAGHLLDRSAIADGIVRSDQAAAGDKTE
jgi:hypothetical protein